MGISLNTPSKIQIISSVTKEIISIDATKTVTANLSNQISTNKAEDKKDITSNVVRQTDKLSLSGFISDMEPDFLSDGAKSLAISAVSKVPWGDTSRLAGAALSKFREPGYRASEICQKINGILDIRQPVTVVTNIFIFENMLIERFSPSQTTEAMNGVMFTMDLVKLRWVSSESVMIRLKKSDPKKKKSVSKQAKKQDLGLQNTEPVSETAKSALKNLMEGIF